MQFFLFYYRYNEHVIENTKIVKTIKEYLEENFKDHKVALGKEKRKLSHEELLNRDYYRGRFASINSKGEYVYNWENRDFK